MEYDNDIDNGYETDYNEDGWVDQALHSYYEDRYEIEADAFWGQYDVADMDIYY